MFTITMFITSLLHKFMSKITVARPFLLGACHPRKFFENRDSEMHSGGVLTLPYSRKIWQIVSKRLWIVFGGIKFDGFGNLPSENDVILNTRPHNHGVLGSLRAHHRQPCAQEDISCSLFLADQRQRYYSIMSVCARVSLRPYLHATISWQNRSGI